MPGSLGTLVNNKHLHLIVLFSSCIQIPDLPNLFRCTEYAVGLVNDVLAMHHVLVSY